MTEDDQEQMIPGNAFELKCYLLHPVHTYNTEHQRLFVHTVQYTIMYVKCRQEYYIPVPSEYCWHVEMYCRYLIWWSIIYSTFVLQYNAIQYPR